MEIHIIRDGEQWGPYSIEEINDDLTEGNLLHDGLAWHEGLVDWTPIKNISGVIMLSEPIKAVIASNDAASVAMIDLDVSGPVFSMEGVGELLEVFEDKIVITPKGVLGFLAKGMQGSKEIPFTSIIAVQLKEAGAFFSGYIQFTIPGGNESKGGMFAAASDENTFMFAGTSSNDLVKMIKEYIDVSLKISRMPHQSSPSTSLSEELQKLAQLKEQGILSDEEFQSAKRKLIG